MGISNNNKNTAGEVFDSASVVKYTPAYGSQNADLNFVPGLLGEGDHDIISVTASAEIGFGKVVYPNGASSGTNVKGTAFGIAARTAKETLKYETGEVANVVTRGKMFAVCVDGCSAGGAVYSDSDGNLYGTSHANNVAGKSVVTITASGTAAGKEVSVRFEIGGKGYNYKTTTTASQTAAQIATALAGATCKDDAGETATLPTGWTVSASSGKVTMAFGTAGLGHDATATFDGGDESGVTATIANTVSANANAVQDKWAWQETATAGKVASVKI